MELKIIEVKQQKIAEVVSGEIVIDDSQDALNLMADAGYYGARSIMIDERNLNPDFFHLHTRLAGDVLLKFAGYQVKLAIIGDFEKYSSNSLKALIRESNRGDQVFFVPDRASAIAKLTK